jgi:2-haloacid dehalogenase
METSRPTVIVFDVNETLSDMTPLTERFAAVGAPPSLAATWFAGVLRDGFALTATGRSARFVDLAADNLRDALRADLPEAALEAAQSHVLEGFAQLDLHPDVRPGIIDMRRAGFRLVTLTNGSVGITDSLLTRAGLRDSFDLVLSVEDAGIWKPARQAYAYAAQMCDVDARDILMVAVHPWDIHGAAEAGLRTAWINRDARRYPRAFAVPDHVAVGLDQLAALLAGAA